MKVGTTPLGDFQGVETEFRRGYWSMPAKGNWNASSGAFPSALFPNDVYEDALAATLRRPASA